MKLAFATIGEAPRDDVVPYLREQLGSEIEIIEDGILNHLEEQERLQLDAQDDSLHMVTRSRDGTAYRLNYQRAIPHMQRVVDGLVEQGADLVVILCGADWSPVTASVPVVNPGKLFPNLVQALGQNLRLGIIKPDEKQIPHTERQFAELGIDAVVTAASPYRPERLELARQAAHYLAEQNVDMVWMTCIGMPESMRAAVQEVMPKPTLLARSVIARVIGELLTVSKTSQQETLA